MCAHSHAGIACTHEVCAHHALTETLVVKWQAKVVGSFAGLRPASQHRDYQIYSSLTDMWVTVAGIRSTGLSASPAIGEYVSELVSALLSGREPASVVHAAESCMRSVSEAVKAGDSCAPARQLGTSVQLDAVPSLRELAADLSKVGDGSVFLWGKRRTVTHPITAFGLEKLGRELEQADAHRV
eukprot:5480629-Pleurochrysis_carterae.AAC.1